MLGSDLAAARPLVAVSLDAFHSFLSRAPARPNPQSPAQTRRHGLAAAWIPRPACPLSPSAARRRLPAESATRPGCGGHRGGASIPGRVHGPAPPTPSRGHEYAPRALRVGARLPLLAR